MKAVLKVSYRPPIDGSLLLALAFFPNPFLRPSKITYWFEPQTSKTVLQIYLEGSEREIRQAKRVMEQVIDGSIVLPGSKVRIAGTYQTALPQYSVGRHLW